MKMKSIHWPGLALLLLAVAVTQAAAQNKVRLGVTNLSGQEVKFTWPNRVLVPDPGAPLFADYQIESSSNLVDWVEVGPRVIGAQEAGAESAIVIRRASGAVAEFHRLRVVMDFAFADFSTLAMDNARLDGAVLSGAGMFRTGLNGASLNHATARGADFQFATLRNGSLVAADLTGARFSDSILNNADFTGANLAYADLGFADLTDAVLAGANLTGTILDGVTDQFTDYHGSIVDETTVMNARTKLVWKIINTEVPNLNLKGFDMSLCNLSEGFLEGAFAVQIDFSGASLRGANLNSADFTGANLRFVELTDSKINAGTKLPAKWLMVWRVVNEPVANRPLAGFNFSNAFMQRAALSGANLRNAIFTLAILAQADLKQADLTGADLSNAQMTFADLTGATLPQANLSGVDFENAVLRGADLTGAFLNGSQLISADLRDADLTNADLLGANIRDTAFDGAVFNNTRMPDGSIVTR